MSPEQKFYNLTDSDLQNLINQFPDKKYFEFAYHQWLNGKTENLPEEWKQWKPWDKWQYPIHDLIRYKHFLLEHIDLIKDKAVVSIGSHIGIDVLFCLHLGAKHCIGVEPFEDKNQLATFICEKAGHNNFLMFTRQLKDRDVYNPMKDYDTMILGSLMDMIPDHYRLVEHIAVTKIKNVIVEMKEYADQAELETPLVKYRQHGEDKIQEGPYFPKADNALHGYPNIAFLKLLFGQFGYEFQKQKFYNMPEELRSVSLFTLADR